MLSDDFRRYVAVLHRMTIEFVQAVPDEEWEFVQHEAIHHGQWAVYAVLAGFETPPGWQRAWNL